MLDTIFTTPCGVGCSVFPLCLFFSTAPRGIDYSKDEFLSCLGGIIFFALGFVCANLKAPRRRRTRSSPRGIGRNFHHTSRICANKYCTQLSLHQAVLDTTFARRVDVGRIFFSQVIFRFGTAWANFAAARRRYTRRCWTPCLVEEYVGGIFSSQDGGVGRNFPCALAFRVHVRR